MNDERLERELRDALLLDEPGPVPDGLRARLATVPDEVPLRNRVTRSANASRLLASIAAVAAVIVVGATILIAVGLRGTTVGPTPSVPASLGSASPSPSAGSPAVAPSASAPVAVAGEWSGLAWSAPLALSDATSVYDIVPFDGGLVAVGQVAGASGSSDVAVWRSSDGTEWAPLARGGSTFAGAQAVHIAVTSGGLVAWGTIGEPVCTGSGEGTTCEPVPVMIWTTSDAITWTRVADLSAFAGATIRAVAEGPLGLAAVGDTGWDEPAIWVSDAGASWQRLALPSSVFKDAHFTDVRATTSGYVVAGGTGTVPSPGVGGPPSSTSKVAAGWWSADGRTWAKATVKRTGNTGTSLGADSIGARGMVAVGSATGGKIGTAWTSPDGRSWSPIAPGYGGAPAVSPGIPTLPSFTLSDDGSHIVAVGPGDGSGVQTWGSSDGVAWQPLDPSGAVDTLPVWPGDGSRPSFDRAILVPGGLEVIGSQTGDSPYVPVWHVSAVQ